MVEKIKTIPQIVPQTLKVQRAWRCSIFIIHQCSLLSNETSTDLSILLYVTAHFAFPPVLYFFTFMSTFLLYIVIIYCFLTLSRKEGFAKRALQEKNN